MTFIAQKLSKGESRYNGKWWPMVPNGDVSKMSAVLYCATCGKPMSLGRHDIREDGSVIPSVVCPNTLGLSHGRERYDEKCGFHEMVVLDGWTTAATQHPTRGISHDHND